MPGALPSRPLSNGHNLAKRTKKRKRGNEKHDSSSKSEDPASKHLKEERRGARRLKNLDTESHTRGHTAEPEDKVLTANRSYEVDEGLAEATRNPEKSRLKEPRKAEKPETNGTSIVPSPLDGKQGKKTSPRNETYAAEEDLAKTARKAEKVRLQSARRAEKTEISGISPIAGPPKLDVDVVEGSKKRSKSTLQPHTYYVEDPVLTALPQPEIDTFLSANFISIDDPAPSNLRPITKFSYLPAADASPFRAFKAPTPIQSAAWPFLLSGRDVIGVAETGSGKTLAFGVPCIRSITTSTYSKGLAPAKAVMISPTRELAVQIHSQIEQLAQPARLPTVCVYGGVPKDQQRAALKRAHIIVATPGRLNDLINEGAADLSSVNFLVLDEADRMLDKGFEEEIRKIISTTPTEGRQTLMFTATWPPSVRELAATFMKQPVHIAIGENNPTGELRANTKIKQVVQIVDPRAKEQRLLQILKQHQGSKDKNERILVFCLYKKEAARVEESLRQRGLKVAGIHGDMGQASRSASLESFKSGQCPLLVATDVAARGLDIPDVKIVVNLTFPLTVEDYVHRIGRTGRAGAQGLAITLFTMHDKAQSGALINVLKAAGQEIPEELLKFGTTVKKKGHEAYGAFYKDVGAGEKKTATKIKFDD